MTEAKTSMPPTGGPEGSRDPRVLGLEKTPVGGRATLGKLIRHDLHGAIYEAYADDSPARLWARITPGSLSIPSNIASLEHPNIATVRGQALIDSGQGAVIFDAPEGESLADRLSREKLIEPDEAINCILQILSALHAVHYEGALHTNLSSDGVFWHRNGKGELEIKLIDHWLGAAGERLNSPHYRAPEQVRHHAPITRATDIWALGVILYEMLQGRRPFDGRTESEVVGKILLMDPRLKPPGTELGKMLLGVVARSMRKKPEDRYQNVTVIIGELLPLQEQLGGVSAEVTSRLRQSLDPQPPLVSAAPVKLPPTSEIPTQRVEPQPGLQTQRAEPTPFAVPMASPQPAPSTKAKLKPSSVRQPTPIGLKAEVQPAAAAQPVAVPPPSPILKAPATAVDSGMMSLPSLESDDLITVTTESALDILEAQDPSDSTAPSEMLVELDDTEASGLSASQRLKSSRLLWIGTATGALAIIAVILGLALSSSETPRSAPVDVESPSPAGPEPRTEAQPLPEPATMQPVPPTVPDTPPQPAQIEQPQASQDEPPQAQEISPPVEKPKTAPSPEPKTASDEPRTPAKKALRVDVEKPHFTKTKPNRGPKKRGKAKKNADQQDEADALASNPFGG